MLRPASGADAGAIHALRESLANWQCAQEIVQWEPGEIALAQIEEQTLRGEWHVLDDTDALTAAVRIIDTDTAIWPDSDRVDAGYIHGLMVSRARSGEGLGELVLRAAENIVHLRGHALVRLDCVASNAALRRYYEARGYVGVGERDFLEDQGWHPVTLFQKALAGTPGIAHNGGPLEATRQSAR